MKKMQNKKKKTGILIGILVLFLIIIVVECVFLVSLFKKNEEDDSANVTPEPTVTEQPTTAPSETQPAETPSPTTKPDTNQEEVDYAVGFAVVEKDDWTSVQNRNDLVLYQDHTERWKVSDVYQTSVILTDDIFYYVSGENEKQMYALNLSDGSSKAIGETCMDCQLVGIIGSNLYLLVVVDSNTDEKVLREQPLDGSASRDITLPEMWGDVGMEICNGQIYYTGGRTDVSATALYRVNMEENKAEVLNESTASGLLVEDDKLYFVHSDSADGSYISGATTVFELDTELEQMNQLLNASYAQTGAFVGVEDEYLIFADYNSEKNGIVVWDCSKMEWQVVPDMEQTELFYLNTDDDKIYYAGYDNTSENEGGITGPYTIYQYDPSQQSAAVVGVTDGNPIRVLSGYIYYSASDEDWNNYLRVEMTEPQQVDIEED